MLVSQEEVYFCNVLNVYFLPVKKIELHFG